MIGAASPESRHVREQPRQGTSGNVQADDYALITPEPSRYRSFVRDHLWLDVTVISALNSRFYGRPSLRHITGFSNGHTDSPPCAFNPPR